MKKTIITIGRELGSGGRTIGKKVAERLGIAYYDREIIDEAAKISGLSADFIKNAEDNVTNSFLYSIVMNAGFSASVFGDSQETLPLDTQVYLAQQEAILKLAGKSCVIVGRCADFVLKDEKNLLRCFIYAPLESRIQRAVNEYGLDKNEAKKTIRQMDKKRSQRYNTYTDQVWGDRGNYDLLIDSSKFGVDGSCDLIIAGLNSKNEEGEYGSSGETE